VKKKSLVQVPFLSKHPTQWGDLLSSTLNVFKHLS